MWVDPYYKPGVSVSVASTAVGLDCQLEAIEPDTTYMEHPVKLQSNATAFPGAGAPERLAIPPSAITGKIAVHTVLFVRRKCSVENEIIGHWD
jgi:hypothetical protein